MTKVNDRLTSDKYERCELLVDQFNSVFSITQPDKWLFDTISFFTVSPHDSDLYLIEIVFSEATIVESNKELSSSSAAGPDWLTASLLLYCSTQLAPALQILFASSFSTGSIHSSLKRAAIVPIFKSGDKIAPKNATPSP